MAANMGEMVCERCGGPLAERWQLGNVMTCSFACLVATDAERRRGGRSTVVLDQPLDLRERAALTILEHVQLD